MSLSVQDLIKAVEMAKYPSTHITLTLEDGSTRRAMDIDADILLAELKKMEE